MNTFKKVLPLLKKYKWIVLGIIILIIVVLLSNKNGFFGQISPFTQEELKENKVKSLWNRMTNLDNNGVYVSDVSSEQLELIKLALQEMSIYEDRYIELQKNVKTLNMEVTKTPKPHNIMLDNEFKVNELGTIMSDLKSTLGYDGVGENNVSNRLTVLETATTPAPDSRIDTNIENIKENTLGLYQLKSTVSDTSTTANRLDNHFFPKLNTTVLQKFTKYFSDRLDELFSDHYETLNKEDKNKFNECLKNMVEVFSQEDLDFFLEYSKKYGDVMTVVGEGRFSDHHKDITSAWKAYFIRCSDNISDTCGLLAESNPIPYNTNDFNNKKNKNPIEILKETVSLERYSFPSLEGGNIVWATGWLTTHRHAYDNYINLYGRGVEFEVWGEGVGYLITLNGITETKGVWRGYDTSDGREIYEIDCTVRLTEKSEDLQKMIRIFNKYTPLLKDHFKNCGKYIFSAIGS